MLDKLSDMNFVQDICDDLHTLFEVRRNDICKICLIHLEPCIFQTDKGFDRLMFEKQMSVMRGQVRFAFIRFRKRLLVQSEKIIFVTVSFQDFEPESSSEGWEEPSAASSNAQCIC